MFKLDQQTHYAPPFVRRLNDIEQVQKSPNLEHLRQRIVHPLRRAYILRPIDEPDVPLASIYTALSANEPFASIQRVMTINPTEQAGQVTHASCYSISTTGVPGMLHIGGGRVLIKGALNCLRDEFPSIQVYTLSPVGPLRKFHAPTPLETTNPARLFSQLHAYLQATTPQRNNAKVSLCDSVAQFHLSNGAQLARINFNGDTSPTALDRCAGFTINYHYDNDIDNRAKLFRDSLQINFPQTNVANSKL